MQIIILEFFSPLRKTLRKTFKFKTIMLRQNSVKKKKIKAGKTQEQRKSNTGNNPSVEGPTLVFSE